MIYNLKTGQQIDISDAMLTAFGSTTEYIKAITLFEYIPENWTTSESYFNWHRYVQSINTASMIKYMELENPNQLNLSLDNIRFRIASLCGPIQLRMLENEKLQRIIEYFNHK